MRSGCGPLDVAEWFAHSASGNIEKSQKITSKAVAALAELLRKKAEEGDIRASQAAWALLRAMVKTPK